MEKEVENVPKIPQWLDAAFIGRNLKRIHPDLVESSVELVSTSLLSNGQIGRSFRVVVLFGLDGGNHPQEISLVVKSQPMSNGIMECIENMGVFRREKTAYRTFLPAVDATLSATLGDDWERPWPRFYAEGSDPTHFLVIEDMNASGFEQIPIAESLSVDHCIVALRALARMHAASLDQLQHHDYAHELFRQSVMLNQQMFDMYGDTFVDNVEKMIRILDEYPWFHKYTDKMNRNSRKFLRDTCEVLSKCAVDFKVMVHGDFKRNNMMFRKDNGSLKVGIYDFQGIHVGSPAEDLVFFLYTSVSVEILRDSVDHLLSEYHRTLQVTLRALGKHHQADNYPLEQLRKDMHHFRVMGIHIIFHILPPLLYDEVVHFSQEESLEEYLEKAEAMREKYCRNERFLRYVEYLTSLFDSQGLLDLPNE